MYHYLIGTTFLKSLNPYFRKHVMTSLEPREYFYLITISIFCWSILVFLFYETEASIKKMISNYKMLEYTQILCIFVISLLVIASSLFLYELDKNYNTPLLNGILLKSISIFTVFAVSLLIFGEKYSWKQIAGICLTILGIFLVTNKTDNDE